ncbi:acid sphingomyelinase-like phosphodiesterase 3b [Genypterus blacodes]|uniref:acid sphingomyelinase-like phosphodiesterase 3b n=1 Tax=Genypterus blacodes TaxID=154954 RepID=UPI003F76BD75
MFAMKNLLLLSCLLFKELHALSGNFWHITDLHLDPSYNVNNDPQSVCESSGKRPATNAGKFGDYACDSPWDLIHSCLYAMKDILADPDFIVWTGDDTPHVPDLGEKKVVDIIRNLTQSIKLVFPNTTVYSALGNHDYHPKSQLPATQNPIYDQIAELWRDWLDPESLKTFKKGGYYTEKLLNQTGLRMLVLNTNLYYDQNNETKDLEDPAEQFAWIDWVLTKAANNKEKVYIIGHVPPGFFEKKRGKPWFTPKFNAKYLELIQKHHSVIHGQFFGHHHTDSFRMFYDSGFPISVMFLSPGVTPWKTTLPGVQDGANNPGIRVFEYDTKTLLVKDVVTYYLNLTQANVAKPLWEEEYRLTESFGVQDACVASMHQVLERMTNNTHYLQKYYEFNSVSYDLTECNATCRVEHLCAAREVDFHSYKSCLGKAAVFTHGGLLPVLTVAVSLILSNMVTQNII